MAAVSMNRRRRCGRIGQTKAAGNGPAARRL